MPLVTQAVLFNLQTLSLHVDYKNYTMKKLLTILLTLFLFGSAYAEVRVVDKLEYRDGIAYAVGESEGFSGKLATTYSNGKKETEINYKNGKQEGLDIWWPSSALLDPEDFPLQSQVPEPAAPEL
jgi:antitoxin component YwqK of YwqJK toxin-antitoxin module